MFNLSVNQRNLIIIYMVGSFIQTLALCYLNGNKHHYGLIVLYFIVALSYAIIYYKLFSD